MKTLLTLTLLLLLTGCDGSVFVITLQDIVSIGVLIIFVAVVGAIVLFNAIKLLFKKDKK